MDFIDNPYFTDIVTVFKDENERTIEFLRQVYDDRDALVIKLNELFIRNGMNERIIGKIILLKPNWVLHNLKNSDEICLRTHDNFTLAALEVVLAYHPHSVLIADAPVQGCKWDQIISSSFIENIQKLENCYKIEVKIKDFRRAVFDPHLNSLTRERNPIEDYIIFDLGAKSFIEPITSREKNLFRVTDYDPDRLKDSHSPGKHKYCIARDFFDADVIITLPKVKTHQKAGITNAIKILVGINGDKDYLPHHRKGGSENGGDCYPGSNLIRTAAENILDSANRRRGEKSYKPLKYLSLLLWKLSFPTSKHSLSAAWHGNDTTWRMVLDINRIAKYGTVGGELTDNPQREIFYLSDGIIGGQGNGPLKPDPLPLGVICLSNYSYDSDAAMASLMGFDIMKIPLIKESLSMHKNKNLKEIKLNGSVVALEELKNLTVSTLPPDGWSDYL
jgi:uncharacterized protein (DUF362 family)